MIMAGMASVLVAMMWLRKVGTMCRRMMRGRLHPASSAARTKSSSRSARNRPRTSRPSVVQPTSDEDDGDREEDLQRRPVPGQRGGQGEPDGDRRQRLQQLDEPLDHQVGHPAEVTGDAAQQHPSTTLSVTATSPMVMDVWVPCISRDH